MGGGSYGLRLSKYGLESVSVEQTDYTVMPFLPTLGRNSCRSSTGKLRVSRRAQPILTAAGPAIEGMLRGTARCYSGSIVPGHARPKQETFAVNKWVDLGVSWLPFLALIGLWFWFSRRSGMQARGASGVTLIELYEQQVAETRRMNGFLERIALSLEKHEAHGGS